MKRGITTICFLLISLFNFAQHSEYYHSESKHQLHDKDIIHGVAFLYGSILIPEYDVHGEAIGKVLLPSVSLDYEFWWQHKVGFLISNEFVLCSYEVQNHMGEFIKRESILISALGFTYSPFKHLGIYAGGGMEMDLQNGQNFGIMRIGAQYSVPIRHDWSSIFAVASDLRNQYTSVSFEVGFAKCF